MEPSTTNSNEIHHKILTPTNVHDDHDHQQRDCDHDHNHEPLIISCEISKPHQEINSSSHQAFLMGNMGVRPEKRLEDEPSGREKPMRQYKEVGKVVIPDKWGQENSLKDWMDYSTFDALLAPKEAGSAREALVEEARRGYRVSNI